MVPIGGRRRLHRNAARTHRGLPGFALAAACVYGCGVEAAVFPPDANAVDSLSEEDRLGRAACEQRFRETDFAEEGFKSLWLSPANTTAFIDCLYKLRTRWRHQQKEVFAGGVHYPTLVTAHHTSPPVSTSGARWCWLDTLGVERNGLDPANCCDKSHGSRGFEACWDDYFSYELCCLGDVNLGELPHFFVAPAMDINVGNAMRQLGTFDLGQSYALQTLCRPGDVVLDIGANLGGFTVPLAERVGIQGEVHAFEPFRKVFQHLNANVALNGLSNVFTHNVALGTDNKVLEIFSPDLTTWNFPSAIRVDDQYSREKASLDANLKYEQRREKVYVRPLDSFEFGGPVRLIKIDVEFMELQVILGARETIKRDRPLMWVENEPYFDEPPNTEFVDTMYREFGYVCKPVARLELLCAPGKKVKAGEAPEHEDGVVPNGFKRVFKHLTGEYRDLHLWKVLSEVDAKFAHEFPI